jgi:hypothetical protein
MQYLKRIWEALKSWLKDLDAEWDEEMANSGSTASART